MKRFVVIAAASLVALARLPAAARFGASGSEFQVNTHTTYTQYDASVASDALGNFVVAWGSYAPPGHDGSSGAVVAQRFDRAGGALGAEFVVNTYTTGDQGDPSVARQANGDFVVVWTGCGGDAQDGSECGIFGRRFASSGAGVGTEFQVNSYTAGQQRHPAVAVDSDGDFVVAWTNYGYYPLGGDGQGSGVSAQRYDSTGAPAGTEFIVNSYTTENQSYPDVSVSPTGSFVVVWQNGGPPPGSHDGDCHGIFAQRFGSDGSRLGADFQVNTYTTACQVKPTIGIAPDGGFVVAWASYGGSYAALFARGLLATGQDGDDAGNFGQRFDSSGARIGTEFQINTYTTGAQDDPSVAVSGDRFVVTWSSYYQDGSQKGIFAQRYTLCPPQPLAGCKTAAKSKLKITNNADDAKDKFLWKFGNGAATDATEFGNPLDATVTAVCVYDMGGLAMTATVPAGGTCGGKPCWKGLKTGYKFKDKTAANDGVFKALLKGSTGSKTKVLFKGKGTALPDPLPLAVPVTVQAVNSSTGSCWTATFSSATTSDGNQFKAKTP